MLTTAIACGIALAFAVWLFFRELALWRMRGELDGALFRYSRRRFLRRTLGCALLAATMVMTFLGLEVLDFTGQLTLFQVYWATVGAFCLALLVLPFLDMRETYKHLLGAGGVDARMQKELERIEKELRQKAAAKERARKRDGETPPRDAP